MTHDVFIACSRKDLARVRPLVAYLQSRGLKVWLDLNDIRAAQLFGERIVAAIRDSRVILAFLSRNSASSDHLGGFFLTSTRVVSTTLSR